MLVGHVDHDFFLDKSVGLFGFSSLCEVEGDFVLKGLFKDVCACIRNNLRGKLLVHVT